MGNFQYIADCFRFVCSRFASGMRNCQEASPKSIPKKHPKGASSFLAEHRRVLAACVVREVNNKLTTGLKTPRSSAEAKRGAKP
jgi:hypothetical protein